MNLGNILAVQAKQTGPVPFLILIVIFASAKPDFARMGVA